MSAVKLYLICQLQSNTTIDRMYPTGFIRACRATSAIDATVAFSNYTSLHALSICRADAPASSRSMHQEPLFEPTPGGIDLCFYELELEDMRRRIGSGMTGWSGLLCVPSGGFNALAQRLCEFNRYDRLVPQQAFEVQNKSVCIGFHIGAFDFPSSRSVPTYQPIADRWEARIPVDGAEVTLIDLAFDRTKPIGHQFDNRSVVATWTLSAYDCR